MNSSNKPPFFQPKSVDEEEVKRGGAQPEVVKKVAAPPPKNKLERKPTEDINESAEAFIRKFRQELSIQRMESIENYKQMLQRGI
ncbi:hypothetical protein CDL12_07796 [Handroanthus impetiginosus]|uniref:Uncharacterized protein n=1 Tax=Handroanthus impetiginosus TaxID=429701 RepID=A0A2G9HPR9_9LAMI|nr:hypothetical protein CDL12_07796 [Handroanthus impetiginosus]